MDIKQEPYLNTVDLHPENQETPIHFIHDWITPNQYLYIKNHFDYQLLNDDFFNVSIEGEVIHPKVFNYEEILKMPAKETNKKINHKIKQKSIDNLKKYIHSNDKQLKERVLEANAAAITFISTILAITFNSNWLILVLIVNFFLFQHAIQGWCPPLPIIRRLGVRTPEEISNEKNIFRFMRGDYTFSKDSMEIFNYIDKDE